MIKRWKHHLDLTHFKFNKDDISDENIALMSGVFEKELSKYLKVVDNGLIDGLYEVIEEFSFTKLLCKSSLSEREEYDMQDEKMHELFNYALNSLYDFGDANGFWIQF